jgi:4-amino-4-deoxy-L-arabinose transferase-like glycosyltransferase
MPYKREIVFVFLILMVLIMSRLFLLDIPLERDEGEYAFIASIDWGEFQPYRDAICQKPPVIFFIYKLAFLLFGESLFSIRLILSCFVFFNALLVYSIARRLFGYSFAVISSIAYAVFGGLADAFLSHSANCEIFMTTFLLVGFILLTAERRTFFSILLSGLIHSCAFFTKPVALPMILWTYIYIYKHPKFLLASIIGFILPLALLISYFFLNGSLHDLLFWVFTYNFKYASMVPLSQYPVILFQRMRQIMDFYLLPPLLVSLGGFLLVFHRENRAVIHFWGWSLAAMIGVSIGGFFRPHSFQQVLPSLAIFCGLACKILAGQTFSIRDKLRSMLTIFILISILAPAIRQSFMYWKLSRGEKVDRIYDGNPFGIAKELGSFLQLHTRLGSSIFILGSEPEFYSHAKRRNYSRFIITYPLFYVNRVSKQWHLDIIDRMSYSLPDTIIVVPLAYSIGNEYFLNMPLTVYLERLVRERYEIIAVSIPDLKKNRFVEVIGLIEQTDRNILVKQGFFQKSLSANYPVQS